ncbi:MAG TPA: DUF393 domain-containing protein [Candidatus Binataceae bacterium]|nr:DUF393 domain-containing protein [Candidatus Binataceae bacterium]
MPEPEVSSPVGRARPGRLAVLYDGTCGMCRASAEIVRTFDNSDKIDLMNFNDDELRAQFPEIKVDALMDELHVIDDRGNVWCGARAVNEILRYQRGIRGMLAWLWYLPGFALLADWQYKRIAASRY